MTDLSVLSQSNRVSNSGASPTGGFNPDSLLLLAKILQSQAPDNSVPTANIGGHNILDARPSSVSERVIPSLVNLAQNGASIIQQKEKGKFINDIHQIMSSTSQNEDQTATDGTNIPGRIRLLQDKLLQNGGEDYGIGLQKIIDSASKGRKYEPQTKQDVIDIEQAKRAPLANKVSGVSRIVGSLQSGGYYSSGEFKKFKSADEARTYAMNNLGADYAAKFPEAEQAISQKFPAPDEHGYSVGQLVTGTKGKYKGKNLKYIGNGNFELAK